MPLLSVIIPTYNSARYVGSAVRSVLEQSFGDLEIIVVDDGSTDSTQEELRSFNHHPQVVVFFQQNQGSASARNTGILKSTGEYIGFLDSDDRWEPQKAERHLSLMTTNRDVDLTFSWWSLVDTDGRDLGRYGRTPIRRAKFEDLLIENVTGTASTMIVRRSALQMAGMFDSHLESNVDLDLILRVALIRERNIMCIPEILTSYRRHSSQITADWRRMRRGWEKVFEKVLEQAPERTESIESKARANQYLYWSYIAWERREFTDARHLLWLAWSNDPCFLSNRQKAWLTSAAILATYFPPAIHDYLIFLGGKLLGRQNLSVETDHET